MGPKLDNGFESKIEFKPGDEIALGENSTDGIKVMVIDPGDTASFREASVDEYARVVNGQARAVASKAKLSPIAILAMSVMGKPITHTRPAPGKVAPESSVRYVRPRALKYKQGRNKPCPCGSGKKFKHCCVEKGL